MAPSESKVRSLYPPMMAQYSATSSILLYGDFHPDRLASSYKRAFETLGHRVVSFDTRQLPDYLSFWLRQRLTHRLTIKSLMFRRIGTAKWNRHFLRTWHAEHPDLVFILNGDFLMPETLRVVRASGTPVFFFHADNPFPPFPNRRPETAPAMRECDCYFIWSRSLVVRLRKAGAPRAEFLGFAWDRTLFPPQVLASEFDHDLVFIGGWDKEREAFLEPLARRFDLKIWGPSYWGRRTRSDSALRACWQGREAMGEEIAHIVARSKIVLNIVRAQNLPDGVIMRTFEIPGCGGFMLSTRTSGAQDLFPEHQSNAVPGGAYFADTDECIEQIEYFLQHEDERRAIAKCAHDIVCHGHSFEDRVRQILKVADEVSSRRP